MTSYVGKTPERRDLYLASRILAGDRRDGDWVQWASDTLIQDLELYDDPRQGIGFWKSEAEAQIANELGECLWAIVGANPFDAVRAIATSRTGLRDIASTLSTLMEANGRGF